MSAVSVPVVLDAVAAELRERPQWVNWRLVQRPGDPKRTKEPWTTDGARRASTVDRATWATFDEAAAAATRGDFDGVGFVFAPDDPFVGIDLDDGLSEADRAAIILALDSYTETSVGGNGAHVFVRASLNGHGRNRRGPFEVYEAGRYFVVTGRHVRGTPTTIEERQAQLDEVLAHFLPPTVAPTPPARTAVPVDLDDEELLEKMFSAPNRANVRRLWSGDVSAYGDDESAADLALCNHLAFWCGRDPNRIDRMFRSSGLYRRKWERESYRIPTIEKAIASCRDTYRNELGAAESVASVPEDGPSQSSRPDPDTVRTRSASRSAEKGLPAIASPCPNVVGTRGGTRPYSTDTVSFDLNFEDAAVFANEDEPGAAALIGDDENILIPQNADVMFYGDGGAGKTTLANDLAVHLAAGEPWLGIPVPHPARVAIVENEGPRPLFRRKLRRKLRAWSGPPMGDRLLTLRDPWGKVSLGEDAVRVALAEAIAAHEVDMVIIGPVTRSGMNEAGTLQQVRDYTDLLAEVRALAGRQVTFLLVHHENRAGQVSGAWEGAVDTLFHVQAQGNGQTRLFIQKARWSLEHHKQKLQLEWAEGEGFEVIDEGDRDDNTVADGILDFVREHGGTGWNKVEVAVTGNGERLRAYREDLLAGARLINRGTPQRMKLWRADDPSLPVAGDEEGA